MTSAFHRPRGVPPGAGSVRHRRVTWRLHPVLTDVLNTLDGTTVGSAFRDRAVEISTLKVMSDPVDYGSALTAYRWLLEWADGDGLPLTASGYLKPADVRALAEVMPTMQYWIFKVTREIDVHPVLSFREYLKEIGLLRKYKGTLRLSRAARALLGDPAGLWRYLADTLVPDEPQFDADASVVVLVHMATTDGDIDVNAVARTLTELGWAHRDGSGIGSGEVYEVWNDLWDVLGNVGVRSSARHRDRVLSPEARILINEALFAEVDGESAR
ncbi:hypothetical protein [Microbacterium sp. MPKO10]|uniref:hypothetical protein n=1 Tax=Microbacterium sp. MPKO10 TaxID=2989818 RepID=UPI0022367E0F|nr:hypothetical protein [Microbacterium sp. MPKO10]MCW4459954.1 hypothetical protein [Microbacterium sp. MPKO10]